MKHAAQDKIREMVKGMSREEEIAFFRQGAEAFEQRLRVARQASTPTDQEEVTALMAKARSQARGARLTRKHVKQAVRRVRNRS